MRLALVALVACTAPSAAPAPDGRSLAAVAAMRDLRIGTFLFDADTPDRAFQSAARR